MNDECLRAIFRHLSLSDITNLASTCLRLLEFAYTDIFPIEAKEIKIRMDREICQSDLLYSTYPKLTYRFFLVTLEKLSNISIRPIGSNVCNRSPENEKENWYLCFEKALKLCPSLKKLTIHNSELEFNEMQILKDVIYSLNELEISSCAEIVWSYCSEL